MSDHEIDDETLRSIIDDIIQIPTVIAKPSISQPKSSWNELEDLREQIKQLTDTVKILSTPVSTPTPAPTTIVKSPTVDAVINTVVEDTVSDDVMEDEVMEDNTIEDNVIEDNTIIDGEPLSAIDEWSIK